MMLRTCGKNHETDLQRHYYFHRKHSSQNFNEELIFIKIFEKCFKTFVQSALKVTQYVLMPTQ